MHFLLLFGFSILFFARKFVGYWCRLTFLFLMLARFGQFFRWHCCCRRCCRCLVFGSVFRWVRFKFFSPFEYLNQFVVVFFSFLARIPSFCLSAPTTLSTDSMQNGQNDVDCYKRKLNQQIFFLFFSTLSSKFFFIIFWKYFLFFIRF